MDKKNTELGFEDSLSISEMYQKWYIDYASYVILERAIPRYEDGLKPVQRRILHALNNMDDGRFNKVANVIGQTMQFHPHGDAAINDALVSLGQKDLMLDTQGNWGDYRTGDRAAASRYIETRLTDFAKQIAFNKNITNFINLLSKIMNFGNPLCVSLVTTWDFRNFPLYCLSKKDKFWGFPHLCFLTET